MQLLSSHEQVARIDWLRNAVSFFDPEYWSGTLNPRPTVDWYLERITDAIDDVAPDGKVRQRAPGERDKDKGKDQDASMGDGDDDREN